MPLAIGFMTIALTLIVLAAIVTDIYLAHRKLHALADSAALAAADSFQPAESSRPEIELTNQDVNRTAERFAQRTWSSNRWSQMQVDGRTYDGHSALVTVSGRYRPVLISPFVPRGIELHATGTARGGLRS